MSGQHYSPMRNRHARLREGSMQADRILRDKLRRFREAMSNARRYRPDEIEAAAKMYEVMLRRK